MGQMVIWSMLEITIVATDIIPLQRDCQLEGLFERVDRQWHNTWFDGTEILVDGRSVEREKKCDILKVIWK